MRGNVVFYVTRQYMKKNKKRTWTAFFGIFLMVLLMTCVFVGKDTAFHFLEQMAEQEKGSWHVSMYDLKPEEVKEIQNLSWVKKTARSKNLGMTDFPESKNESRPYLNIKAYEEPEFGWMNISLKEGRLPENEKELVISEAALEDGASLQVGDSVEAAFFERSVTAKKWDVIFPFYSLEVKKGETVSVPENFPSYGETDSFTENKEYTGQSEHYTVVGIMEAPFYEESGSATYTALTAFQETEEETVNLVLKMDLDRAPDDFYTELRKVADGRNIEFNDRTLIFSGSSSNSTLNLMVRGAEAFFTIFIMAASIVLIANIFQLSFRERSRYLGMLSSVGATGKQKRSSVYYEAGSLLLGALPLGILAGFGVVLGGMKLLKPYLVRFMNWGSQMEAVPIQLSFSIEALAVAVSFSALTVFLAAFLPARRVGRIGAIDSIRGNWNSKKRKGRKIRYRKAETLLAKAFVRRQPERSGSIRRAVSVFLVLLLVTASGSEAVSLVAEKKLGGDESLKIRGFSSEETGVVYAGRTGDGERRKAYEEIREEILQDPDTEKTQEWYSCFWAGQVGRTVYSQEYWDAYHDIFNQYYHRVLSDEEFEALSTSSSISLFAPEDAVLQEIAKAAGVDGSKLTDPDQPGILFIQSGHLSTDNIIASSDVPEHYRYYDIQHMTDLKAGDSFSASFYSGEQEAAVDLPMTVAGTISREEATPWILADSEELCGIISRETQEKIEKLAKTELFEAELHLKLKRTDGALMEKLNRILAGEEMDNQQVVFISHAQSELTVTMTEAILGMIRILLICFVLLTSGICLLNLYHSIRGYLEERRREFAMLFSIGMTKKQLRKELFLEVFRLLFRSLSVGLLLAAILIFGIQKGLILLFGYLSFPVPVAFVLFSLLFTGGAVFGIFAFHLKKFHSENLLEEIRRDSV